MVNCMVDWRQPGLYTRETIVLGLQKGGDFNALVDQSVAAAGAFSPS